MRVIVVSFMFAMMGAGLSGCFKMDNPQQLGVQQQQTTSTTGVQAFQTTFYAFATAPGSCVQCHGVIQSPSFAIADVNTAYNNAKPFANFQNPATSLLAQYAGNGHCSLPACNSTAGAAALVQLQAWANAELGNGGTTGPTGPINTTPVTDLEALSAIYGDLLSQPAATQPYLRYFTLEGVGNAAVPLVSFPWTKAGMIKMINSVSMGSAIVQPVAIDANKLIYRVDMRQLKWTAAAWTNIKTGDPYFDPALFPATLATAASQTIRADYFIYQMNQEEHNVIAQDAYYSFLWAAPTNTSDTMADTALGVNRFKNEQLGTNIVRVGMGVSNTEPFNRLIEWMPTTMGPGGSGHDFRSYNFDSDVGAANIFAHPYMPTQENPLLHPSPSPGATASPTPAPSAYASYDFTYADSDNIYTLPNGLNGWFTSLGDFNLLVSPNNGTGTAFGGAARCFECHDNKTNMITLTEVMHNTIQQSAPGTYPTSLETILLGEYSQTNWDAKTAAAGAVFATAYNQLNLGITETPGYNTESMNAVGTNYGLVLGINTAAAELGVTPAALIADIKGNTSLSLALGSLITVDSNNQPNGQIRRDTWEVWYPYLRYTLFPASLPKPAIPPI